MNLRELRYQVNFQYIKDIRRYLYEIEEQILQMHSSFSIQPTPQLPDNINPSYERLVLVDNSVDITRILNISQVGFTIITRINNEEGLDLSQLEFQIKAIYNLANEIKKIVASVIDSYELSHEVITLIKGQVYSEKKPFENFIKFGQNIDETISSTTIDLEDKYFITNEKSARKVFDLSNNKNFYPKNNSNNFLGYQVVSTLHISTRLSYNLNNAVEDLSLSIDNILRLSNEHF